MPATAGSDTRAVYLWEDDASGNHNFAGTPNDTTHKTFGHDVTIDSAELSNNPVDLFDPGSREAAERIAQAFDGTWSVSFTLANPWFWKAVIAEASTSGTGPYTHAFDGEVPWSMRLILPVETTGNERLLKGCVVSSCTLETSDNGTVTVTLDGAYADEEETQPGTGSIQAQEAETFDALTFADGTLTFDGTTFSLVQNVSLTIENNIDMVPELGSRTAADYSPKVRSTSVDFGKIVENDANLIAAYGGGTAPVSPSDRIDGGDEVSGSLTFSNGATDSTQNDQTINVGGSLPDSYGRTGTGDPTADYLENLTYGARTVDVSAVNAVSSAE